MSRLATINVNEATGVTGDLFAGITKAIGRVPNVYATIGTHSPAALSVALGGDAVLAKSGLDKRDIEAIMLSVSEVAGCDYCVAAHSAIAKMVGLPPDDAKRIRAGHATGNEKRDALVAFVRHLVTTRGTIDQASLDEVRAAGYSEAQVIGMLYAISAVTFTNLVNRVNDTVIDFPAVS